MNLISGTILFTLAYGLFGVAQPSKLPPPVTLFSPQNEVTSQQDVWEDGCPPAIKLSDTYTTFEARVLEVIDGNTLIVQSKDSDRKTVHMVGIAAPDIKTPLGIASKDHLASLVLGKDVQVWLISTNEKAATSREATGKIVLFNSEKLDINLEQIKAGMARYRDFGPYTQDARDTCLFQKADTKAKVAQSQDASRALVNPPSWILGSWKNSAESNGDNFETFKFTPDGIVFKKGFMDKGRVVIFNGKYKDYKVTEAIELNLYRVEFYKGKNEIVYEFKLCELDTCKTPSTSGALTYSIIKNGKVVRAHETSIQLVLFRWRST